MFRFAFCGFTKLFGGGVDKILTCLGEEEPPQEQRKMEEAKLLEARLDRVRCLPPLPQARVLFWIVMTLLKVGWVVTSALVWLAQVFRVMCSKLEAPMDTGQAALNRMGEEMQLNLPSKPFTVAKTEQGGSTFSRLLLFSILAVQRRSLH